VLTRPERAAQIVKAKRSHLSPEQRRLKRLRSARLDLLGLEKADVDVKLALCLCGRLLATRVVCAALQLTSVGLRAA
jgi:hypothetical protein